MKISVIIPTLNESGNVAQAIRSAHDVGAAEVIVVDGGSSDDTVDVAAKLGCLVLTSSTGRDVQQNHGAELASGEILVFLHADSRLPAGASANMTATLSRSGVAGGAFDQRIDAQGFAYRLIERGNALRVRLYGMAYGDQAIFVRRQLFEKVGGFPASQLMEDVLFVRKLRTHGRIVLIAGPLTISARRWQRHGVLRQTLRNWLILLAERIGVSPNYLARHYRSCPDRAESSGGTRCV